MTSLEITDCTLASLSVPKHLKHWLEKETFLSFVLTIYLLQYLLLPSLQMEMLQFQMKIESRPSQSACGIHVTNNVM